MAEKVAKLGINRDKDFMYFVKQGAVWRVPRKQPGVQKGRPEKLHDTGLEQDNAYLYFVDRNGDLSRAKRVVGGRKRSGTKKKGKRKAAKRTVKKAKKGAAKTKTKRTAKGRAKGGKAARKKK